MTDDRWHDLLGRLQDDGKVQSRETVELEGRPGNVERVVVESPLGRLRLSRTTEPKRLGEKAFYSKRGGSTMNVQASYDESEQIHVFTVEQASPDGTWETLDVKGLSL